MCVDGTIPTHIFTASQSLINDTTSSGVRGFPSESLPLDLHDTELPGFTSRCDHPLAFCLRASLSELSLTQTFVFCFLLW